MKSLLLGFYTRLFVVCLIEASLICAPIVQPIAIGANILLKSNVAFAQAAPASTQNTCHAYRPTPSSPWQARGSCAGTCTVDQTGAAKCILKSGDIDPQVKPGSTPFDTGNPQQPGTKLPAGGPQTQTLPPPTTAADARNQIRGLEAQQQTASPELKGDLQKQIDSLKTQEQILSDIENMAGIDGVPESMKPQAEELQQQLTDSRSDYQKIQDEFAKRLVPEEGKVPGVGEGKAPDLGPAAPSSFVVPPGMDEGNVGTPLMGEMRERVEQTLEHYFRRWDFSPEAVQDRMAEFTNKMLELKPNFTAFGEWFFTPESAAGFDQDALQAAKEATDKLFPISTLSSAGMPSFRQSEIASMEAYNQSGLEQSQKLRANVFCEAAGTCGSNTLGAGPSTKAALELYNKDPNAGLLGEITAKQVLAASAPGLQEQLDACAAKSAAACQTVNNVARLQYNNFGSSGLFDDKEALASIREGIKTGAISGDAANQAQALLDRVDAINAHKEGMSEFTKQELQTQREALISELNDLAAKAKMTYVPGVGLVAPSQELAAIQGQFSDSVNQLTAVEQLQQQGAAADVAADVGKQLDAMKGLSLTPAQQEYVDKLSAHKDLLEKLAAGENVDPKQLAASVADINKARESAIEALKNVPETKGPSPLSLYSTPDSWLPNDTGQLPDPRRFFEAGASPSEAGAQPQSFAAALTQANEAFSKLSPEDRKLVLGLDPNTDASQVPTTLNANAGLEQLTAQMRRAEALSEIALWNRLGVMDNKLQLDLSGIGSGATADTKIPYSLTEALTDSEKLAVSGYSEQSKHLDSVAGFSKFATAAWANNETRVDTMSDLKDKLEELKSDFSKYNDIKNDLLESYKAAGYPADAIKNIDAALEKLKEAGGNLDSLKDGPTKSGSPYANLINSPFNILNAEIEKVGSTLVSYEKFGELFDQKGAAFANSVDAFLSAPANDFNAPIKAFLMANVHDLTEIDKTLSNIQSSDPLAMQTGEFPGSVTGATADELRAAAASGYLQKQERAIANMEMALGLREGDKNFNDTIATFRAEKESVLAQLQAARDASSWNNYYVGPYARVAANLLNDGAKYVLDGLSVNGNADGFAKMAVGLPGALASSLANALNSPTAQTLLEQSSMTDMQRTINRGLDIANSVLLVPGSAGLLTKASTEFMRTFVGERLIYGGLAEFTGGVRNSEFVGKPVLAGLSGAELNVAERFVAQETALKNVREFRQAAVADVKLTSEGYQTAYSNVGRYYDDIIASQRSAGNLEQAAVYEQQLARIQTSMQQDMLTRGVTPPGTFRAATEDLKTASQGATAKVADELKTADAAAAKVESELRAGAAPCAARSSGQVAAVLAAGSCPPSGPIAPKEFEAIKAEARALAQAGLTAGKTPSTLAAAASASPGVRALADAYASQGRALEATTAIKNMESGVLPTQVQMQNPFVADVVKTAGYAPEQIQKFSQAVNPASQIPYTAAESAMVKTQDTFKSNGVTLKDSQVQGIKSTAINSNHVVIPTGEGKSYVAVGWAQVQRELFGAGKVLEISVPTAEQAAKYADSLKGAGVTVPGKYESLFNAGGNQVQNLSKIYAEKGMPEVTKIVTSNPQNTVLLVDRELRGFLNDEAIRNPALRESLSKTNVLIDEVDALVTDPSQSIISKQTARASVLQLTDTAAYKVGDVLGFSKTAQGPPAYSKLDAPVQRVSTDAAWNAKVDSVANSTKKEMLLLNDGSGVSRIQFSSPLIQEFAKAGMELAKNSTNAQSVVETLRTLEEKAGAPNTHVIGDVPSQTNPGTVEKGVIPVSATQEGKVSQVPSLRVQAAVALREGLSVGEAAKISRLNDAIAAKGISSAYADNIRAGNSVTGMTGTADGGGLATKINLGGDILKGQSESFANTISRTLSQPAEGSVGPSRPDSRILSDWKSAQDLQATLPKQNTLLVDPDPTNLAQLKQAANSGAFGGDVAKVVTNDIANGTTVGNKPTVQKPEDIVSKSAGETDRVAVGGLDLSRGTDFQGQWREFMSANMPASDAQQTIGRVGRIDANTGLRSDGQVYIVDAPQARLDRVADALNNPVATRSAVEVVGGERAAGLFDDAKANYETMPLRDKIELHMQLLEVDKQGLSLGNQASRALDESLIRSPYESILGDAGASGWFKDLAQSRYEAAINMHSTPADLSPGRITASSNAGDKLLQNSLDASRQFSKQQFEQLLKDVEAAQARGQTLSLRDQVLLDRWRAEIAAADAINDVTKISVSSKALPQAASIEETVGILRQVSPVVVRSEPAALGAATEVVAGTSASPFAGKTMMDLASANGFRPFGTNPFTSAGSTIAGVKDSLMSSTGIAGVWRSAGENFARSEPASASAGTTLASNQIGIGGSTNSASSIGEAGSKAASAASPILVVASAANLSRSSADTSNEQAILVRLGQFRPGAQEPSFATDVPTLSINPEQNQPTSPTLQAPQLAVDVGSPNNPNTNAGKPAQSAPETATDQSAPARPFFSRTKALFENPILLTTRTAVVGGALLYGQIPGAVALLADFAIGREGSPTRFVPRLAVAITVDVITAPFTALARGIDAFSNRNVAINTPGPSAADVRTQAEKDLAAAMPSAPDQAVDVKTIAQAQEALNKAQEELVRKTYVKVAYNPSSPIASLEVISVKGLSTNDLLQLAKEQPAPEGYIYMYRGLTQAYQAPALSEATRAKITAAIPAPAEAGKGTPEMVAAETALRKFANNYGKNQYFASYVGTSLEDYAGKDGYMLRMAVPKEYTSELNSPLRGVLPGYYANMAYGAGAYLFPKEWFQTPESIAAIDAQADALIREYVDARDGASRSLASRLLDRVASIYNPRGTGVSMLGTSFLERVLLGAISTDAKPLPALSGLRAFIADSRNTEPRSVPGNLYGSGYKIRIISSESLGAGGDAVVFAIDGLVIGNGSKHFKDGQRVNIAYKEFTRGSAGNAFERSNDAALAGLKVNPIYGVVSLPGNRTALIEPILNVDGLLARPGNSIQSQKNAQGAITSITNFDTFLKEYFDQAVIAATPAQPAFTGKSYTTEPFAISVDTPFFVAEKKGGAVELDFIMDDFSREQDSPNDFSGAMKISTENLSKALDMYLQRVIADKNIYREYSQKVKEYSAEVIASAQPYDRSTLARSSAPETSPITAASSDASVARSILLIGAGLGIGTAISLLDGGATLATLGAAALNTSTGKLAVASLLGVGFNPARLFAPETGIGQEAVSAPVTAEVAVPTVLRTFVARNDAEVGVQLAVIARLEELGVDKKLMKTARSDMGYFIASGYRNKDAAAAVKKTIDSVDENLRRQVFTELPLAVETTEARVQQVAEIRPLTREQAMAKAIENAAPLLWFRLNPRWNTIAVGTAIMSAPFVGPFAPLVGIAFGYKGMSNSYNAYARVGGLFEYVINRNQKKATEQGVALSEADACKGAGGGLQAMAADIEGICAYYGLKAAYKKYYPTTWKGEIVKLSTLDRYFENDVELAGVYKAPTVALATENTPTASTPSSVVTPGVPFVPSGNPLIKNSGPTLAPEGLGSISGGSSGITVPVRNQKIEGWHGSPYDFVVFDYSKIGNGDGNVAKGYGLYFASKKSIGEGYRDSLSASGKGHLYKVAIQTSADRLFDWNKSLSQQSSFVRQVLEKEFASEIQTSRDLLAAEIAYRSENPGSATRYSNSYVYSFLMTTPAANPAMPVSDLTGEEIYSLLALQNRDEILSQKMFAFGIDGIRAHDAESFVPRDLGSLRKEVAQLRARAENDPTGPSIYKGTDNTARYESAKRSLDEYEKILANPSYNYIIFSDSVVSITEKDGLPVQASLLAFGPRPSAASLANGNASISTEKAVSVPAPVASSIAEASWSSQLADALVTAENNAAERNPRQTLAQRLEAITAADAEAADLVQRIAEAISANENPDAEIASNIDEIVSATLDRAKTYGERDESKDELLQAASRLSEASTVLEAGNRAEAIALLENASGIIEQVVAPNLADGTRVFDQGTPLADVLSRGSAPIQSGGISAGESLRLVGSIAWEIAKAPFKIGLATVDTVLYTFSGWRQFFGATYRMAIVVGVLTSYAPSRIATQVSNEVSASVSRSVAATRTADASLSGAQVAISSVTTGDEMASKLSEISAGTYDALPKNMPEIVKSGIVLAMKPVQMAAIAWNAGPAIISSAQANYSKVSPSPSEFRKIATRAQQIFYSKGFSKADFDNAIKNTAAHVALQESVWLALKEANRLSPVLETPQLATAYEFGKAVSESSWPSNTSRSRAGADGLYQMMIETASDLGVPEANQGVGRVNDGYNVIGGLLALNENLLIDTSLKGKDSVIAAYSKFLMGQNSGARTTGYGIKSYDQALAFNALIEKAKAGQAISDREITAISVRQIGTNKTAIAEWRALINATARNYAPTPFSTDLIAYLKKDMEVVSDVGTELTSVPVIAGNTDIVLAGIDKTQITDIVAGERGIANVLGPNGADGKPTVLGTLSLTPNQKAEYRFTNTVTGKTNIAFTLKRDGGTVIAGNETPVDANSPAKPVLAVNEPYTPFKTVLPRGAPSLQYQGFLVGDSLMVGYFAGNKIRTQASAAVSGQWIENKGIKGATGDIMRQVDTIPATETHIGLDGGTNDISSDSAAVVFEKVTRLVQKLESKGKVIDFFIGPSLFKNAQTHKGVAEKSADLDKQLRAYFEGKGIPYFSINDGSIVSNELIGTNADYEPDGYHLTTAGYKKVYDAVAARLSKPSTEAPVAAKPAVPVQTVSLAQAIELFKQASVSGDSLARDFFNSRPSMFGSVFSHPGLLSNSKKAAEDIAAMQKTGIFLVGTTDSPSNPTGEHSAQKVITMLEAYISNGGKPLVVVGPSIFKNNIYAKEGGLQKAKLVDAALAQWSGQKGIPYVSLFKIPELALAGNMYDNLHISKAGNQIVLTHMLAAMTGLSAKSPEVLAAAQLPANPNIAGSGTETTKLPPTSTDLPPAFGSKLTEDKTSALLTAASRGQSINFKVRISAGADLSAKPRFVLFLHGNSFNLDGSPIPEAATFDLQVAQTKGVSAGRNVIFVVPDLGRQAGSAPQLANAALVADMMRKAEAEANRMAGTTVDLSQAPVVTAAFSGGGFAAATILNSGILDSRIKLSGGGVVILGAQYCGQACLNWAKANPTASFQSFTTNELRGGTDLQNINDAWAKALGTSVKTASRGTASLFTTSDKRLLAALPNASHNALPGDAEIFGRALDKSNPLLNAAQVAQTQPKTPAELAIEQKRIPAGYSYLDTVDSPDGKQYRFVDAGAPEGTKPVLILRRVESAERTYTFEAGKAYTRAEVESEAPLTLKQILAGERAGNGNFTARMAKWGDEIRIKPGNPAQLRRMQAFSDFKVDPKTKEWVFTQGPRGDFLAAMEHSFRKMAAEKITLPVVNSPNRDTTTNANLPNSAPDSCHLYFCSFDIQMTKDAQKITQIFRSNGLMVFNEGDHLHVEMPGLHAFGALPTNPKINLTMVTQVPTQYSLFTQNVAGELAPFGEGTKFALEGLRPQQGAPIKTVTVDKGLNTAVSQFVQLGQLPTGSSKLDSDGKTVRMTSKGKTYAVSRSSTDENVYELKLNDKIIATANISKPAALSIVFDQSELPRIRPAEATEEANAQKLVQEKATSPILDRLVYLFAADLGLTKTFQDLQKQYIAEFTKNRKSSFDAGVAFGRRTVEMWRANDIEIVSSPNQRREITGLDMAQAKLLAGYLRLKVKADPLDFTYKDFTAVFNSTAAGKPTSLQGYIFDNLQQNFVLQLYALVQGMEKDPKIGKNWSISALHRDPFFRPAPEGAAGSALTSPHRFGNGADLYGINNTNHGVVFNWLELNAAKYGLGRINVAGGRDLPHLQYLSSPADPTLMPGLIAQAQNFNNQLRLAGADTGTAVTALSDQTEADAKRKVAVDAFRKVASNAPIVPTLANGVKSAVREVQMGNGTAKLNIRESGGEVAIFRVHEDERPALTVGNELLKSFPGRFVDLSQTGARNLQFTVNGQQFAFDPNRIFSEQGITATLAAYSANKSSPEARAEVQKLSKAILEYVQPGKPILALHNNRSATFLDQFVLRAEGDNRPTSFSQYPVLMKYESTDARYSKQEFVVVSSAALFEKMKALNISVVLEKTSGVDDGSLSYYAIKNGIPYINIEARNNSAGVALQMEIAKKVMEAFGLKPSSPVPPNVASDEATQKAEAAKRLAAEKLAAEQKARDEAVAKQRAAEEASKKAAEAARVAQEEAKRLAERAKAESDEMVRLATQLQLERDREAARKQAALEAQASVGQDAEDESIGIAAREREQELRKEAFELTMNIEAQKRAIDAAEISAQTAKIVAQAALSDAQRAAKITAQRENIAERRALAQQYFDRAMDQLTAIYGTSVVEQWPMRTYREPYGIRFFRNQLEDASAALLGLDIESLQTDIDELPQPGMRNSIQRAIAEDRLPKIAEKEQEFRAQAEARQMAFDDFALEFAQKNSHMTRAELDSAIEGLNESLKKYYGGTEDWRSKVVRTSQDTLANGYQNLEAFERMRDFVNEGKVQLAASRSSAWDSILAYLRRAPAPVATVQTVPETDPTPTDSERVTTPPTIQTKPITQEEIEKLVAQKTQEIRKQLDAAKKAEEDARAASVVARSELERANKALADASAKSSVATKAVLDISDKIAKRAALAPDIEAANQAVTNAKPAIRRATVNPSLATSRAALTQTSSVIASLSKLAKNTSLSSDDAAKIKQLLAQMSTRQSRAEDAWRVANEGDEVAYSQARVQQELALQQNQSDSVIAIALGALNRFGTVEGLKQSLNSAKASVVTLEKEVASAGARVVNARAKAEAAEEVVTESVRQSAILATAIDQAAERARQQASQESLAKGPEKPQTNVAQSEPPTNRVTITEGMIHNSGAHWPPKGSAELAEGQTDSYVVKDATGRQVFVVPEGSANTYVKVYADGTRLGSPFVYVLQAPVIAQAPVTDVGTKPTSIGTPEEAPAGEASKPDNTTPPTPASTGDQPATLPSRRVAVVGTTRVAAAGQSSDVPVVDMAASPIRLYDSFTSSKLYVLPPPEPQGSSFPWYYLLIGVALSQNANSQTEFPQPISGALNAGDASELPRVVSIPQSFQPLAYQMISIPARYELAYAPVAVAGETKAQGNQKPATKSDDKKPAVDTKPASEPKPVKRVAFGEDGKPVPSAPPPAPSAPGSAEATPQVPPAPPAAPPAPPEDEKRPTDENTCITPGGIQPKVDGKCPGDETQSETKPGGTPGGIPSGGTPSGGVSSGESGGAFNPTSILGALSNLAKLFTQPEAPAAPATAPVQSTSSPSSIPAVSQPQSSASSPASLSPISSTGPLSAITKLGDVAATQASSKPSALNELAKLAALPADQSSSAAPQTLSAVTFDSFLSEFQDFLKLLQVTTSVYVSADLKNSPQNLYSSYTSPNLSGIPTPAAGVRQAVTSTRAFVENAATFLQAIATRLGQ